MPAICAERAKSCEELWHDHADALVLYSAALVGDRATAEDVVQRVFARLLARDLRPAGGSPGAYLFRAVRNESRNAVRSRNRFDRVRGGLFEPAACDPADAAQQSEFRRRTEAALARLPEEQREAVVLKIWGGLSFEDGASVVPCTPKAFEHRYYRALEILRGVLGE